MSYEQVYYYSAIYCDRSYEYRHVIIPNHLVKFIPTQHLMTETEWRNLGIQQSQNWVNYMYHEPEPNVLLFRRPRQNENE
ncbi:CKS domain containing protein [Asbolus verrucosus]|uniref:Cyclin-dependent kinases regulatory subunit n=1 Tax=Asbolus verrucosus TaxID=1661398 RepID=A0A482W078_ASBVE|nr:CKS domain containing protein [Asbolus verrucosus]